ncbi:TonB-dependent receptor [Sphingomonas oryzagri]
MNRIALFGTASTLLLGAGASSAQQGTLPSAQPAVSDTVEDIVVTARKVSENLQSVPVAVTALNGAALANASIRTTNDLQSQIPNLYIQKSSNDPQAFYVAIRGQKQDDLPLTLDPSVGIYINGMYVPRTYGLASALVDLDRVEVLRGPQGTLYGRNTTGGAISFFGKDPTDKLGASVDVTGGNYGAWNVVGILNAPLADGVGLRIVGQRGEHDGYGHDALGRDLDDEDSSYLRATLKGQIGSRITATLWGDYSKNKTGGLIAKFAGISQGSPPGGAATVEAAAENGDLSDAAIGAAVGQLQSYTHTNGFYDTNGTARGASRYEGEKAGLDVKADLGGGITLRSITGYQHFRRTAGGDLDGTPVNILTSLLGTYDRYLSEEIQLLGGNKRFNWVVGLYGGDERGKEYSVNTILADINPGNPNDFDAFVRNRSGAVFAQANWEFIDGWRLTGGARYSSDRREIISLNTNAGVCVVPAPGVESTPPGDSQCPRTFKKTFSKPSWLASIDHQFTRDIMGYAKVSRGYRTGGFNYRGANEEETFASFQPEIVTEYEVGAKTELFDRHLRFNVAAYHDDYRDIQRSITVPTSGGAPATIVTNAAKARINGFETEATLRVSHQFTLNGSAGLTDAKYKKFVDLTGDRSGEHFDVPKWTASAGARLTQPTRWGEAALQADLHWQSKVYLVPSAPTLSQVAQSEYGLLDLRATLDLDRWNAQIALFGKNVAGKHYLASAISLESALGYNYVVPGEPRTFGIEITKRFGGI